MDELDRQLETDRVAAKKREHEQRCADTLRNMVKREAPTAEECDIMLGGLRLARFVSDLECENCKLDCEDHTLNWLFLTKICLKEYHALRRRLGLQPLAVKP